jgi:hypothetical protein
MRKRWPAIEPHWRVLYRNGRLGDRWEQRQSAYSFVRMMQHAGHPMAAVVKITPK